MGIWSAIFGEDVPESREGLREVSDTRAIRRERASRKDRLREDDEQNPLPSMWFRL